MEVPAGTNATVLRLVGAAIAWGFVLLILATAVPIVTPHAPTAFPADTTPTSSAGAGGSVPLPTAGVPAPAIAAVPQVTLVEQDGYGVLLLVALPTVASLVVGLLLWLRGAMRVRWVGIAAWIVAVAVLAGGVVGFVTFLIGLAIVPTGVLLVIACVRAAPRPVSPNGVV